MTPAVSIPEGRIGSGSVSSKWFGVGLADRVLKLFTTVEPREGMGALLLAANVFLLLTAYYILKTAREALILADGGAEVKAYASAGQARCRGWTLTTPRCRPRTGSRCRG